MSYPSPLASSTMRNSAFGAFAAAALGFALLETACILIAAAPAVHLAAILAGAALVSVSLRRFLRHWPARHGELRGLRALPASALPWRVLAAVLVAAGAFLAAAALSSGLVTPFILFALALVLVPWARFAQTRAHCLGHALAAAGGSAAGLVAFGMRFHPMLLLAIAWMLWLSAILGWMRIVFIEKTAERRAAAW